MTNARAQRVKQLVLLVCLVVSAAWLLSPALTAVHVEGYSAQLIGIADAFDGDGVAHYDPLMPLPTEFLYLTRFGTVMLLAIIHHFFGPVGDAGFKCLTLFSFAVLIAASVSFARTRGRVPIWACCTALLLLPGLPQISFYFNDNVVSAAFVATSLAVIVPAATWPRYLAAGLLAGCGVTCRIDAIIALPMLFGIASIAAPRPAVALRSICILAGIGAALTAARWFGGFDLVAALKVGALFGAYHDFNIDHRLLICALFFNFLGTAAIVYGCAINLRREMVAGDVRWCLAFVVLPVILLVAAFYEATNLRYGYPLFAPLFALHGGKGVASVTQLWQTRGRAAVAVILFAGALISVAPRDILMTWDGPQSLSGRVWEPVAWRTWQRHNSDSAAAIDAWLGDIGPSSRVVVITAHYNDDFFLRQRLLDTGYTVHKAQDLLPGCDGFFIYTKGDRTVAQVRTDTLYALAGMHLGAAQLAEAAKCQALGNFDPDYLSNYAGDDSFLPTTIYGRLADRFSHSDGVEFVRLSRQEFDGILSRATTVAPTLRTRDGSPLTYAHFNDYYRSRFMHSNPRWPG